MASLDDILTAQKNGVVALSSLSQTYANMFTFSKGTNLSKIALSTATTTLYTVPTGVQFTLNDIEICNTSGSPATFTIYLVPSGTASSNSNALFYSAPIAGNTTVQWTGSQILTAGATIQASASTTNVTVMISGGQG